MSYLADVRHSTWRPLVVAALGVWLAGCNGGGPVPAASGGAAVTSAAASPTPEAEPKPAAVAEPRPSAAPRPVPAAAAFEVMSYNVAWGRPDGRRLDDTADIIAESGADVVGVQQLRRFSRVQKGGDYGCEDQPALLNEMLRARTGDRWSFVFAANASGPQSTRHCKSVTTEPREEGVAIFSRFPIRHRATHRLPYTRRVAEARVEAPGGPVTVFTVHLDSGSAGRRVTQARVVAGMVRARAGPVLLTGDINGTPGSPEVGILLDVTRDSFAEAGVGDGRTRRGRIDYVLYRGGVQPETAFVLQRTASDHRPVLARFRM